MICYRRIQEFGLRSCRPQLVLPLTPEHKSQRLEWCREPQQWNDEWKNVVFSCESRFYLGTHDGCKRVRKRRGERQHMQFAVERHVHCTVGVMVWGAIGYGSRSSVVFVRDNMTSLRYVDDILRPSLLPCIQELLEALFQQDNARPHIARGTINFFANSHVNLLAWPPRSPDLSPIEHMWDMMGVRIS